MTEEQVVAESTPAEETEVQAELPLEAELQAETKEPDQEASAETKNTETPGPIPYDRFKEVNEQAKQFKEAAEELDKLKQSQDYQGYKALKQKLDEDQAYAQWFVEQHQKSAWQGQQADPYADYPEEIAGPLRKTQMLEAQVQQLQAVTQNQQQEGVFNQYRAALSEKTKDMPEHWKGYVERRALEIGRQMNPNALATYDEKLVNNVFETVSQEVEAIRRAERGSYVVEKKNDKLPVSSSGSGTPGQVSQKPQTAEDRSQLAEDLLKAALE